MHTSNIEIANIFCFALLKILNNFKQGANTGINEMRIASLLRSRFIIR